jgi:hypothetical protein
MSDVDAVRHPEMRGTAVMTVGYAQTRATARWSALVVMVALLIVFVPVHRALAAEYGVAAFDGQVTADATGTPFSQAAGHPYSATTTIAFNTEDNPTYGTGWPVEPTKDIIVDLPPGLAGNLSGLGQCTAAELSPTNGSLEPTCSIASQVGIVTILVPGGLGFPFSIPFQAAVYNMVPPPNVPARIGFQFSGAVVLLDAELRSGSDFGISFNVRNASETLALAGTSVAFWGTPADPSHDPERSCPGELPAVQGGPSCSSQALLKPFLRNPTACTPAGVGLKTTVRTDSWFNPGVFKSASFLSHDPPTYTLDNPVPPDQWGPQQGPTGCDQVPFNPTLKGAPKVSAAGQPSGFSFDVDVPQSDVPESIDTGDVKKVVTTLPAGVRISPSAADGLEGCSEGQIGLVGTNFPEPNPIHFDTSDPTCPDTSKIGTLTITTPLLDQPLDGAIYLATPNQNPFGTLLAVYLVAKGPGVIIKLPGEVQSDPSTGQLTATFDHNPQLPFSNLHLEFNNGPRAPLVTPARCGTYTTHSVLTSWSGATAVSDSTFVISEADHDTPCPLPAFHPSFVAGSDNPVAGTSSPFRLSLSRDDQEQELSGLTINTPQGLLARIRDVPLCPAAQAAAGTCGASSQIGSVTVAAGPGTNPFFIQNGRMYIAGPYKGAPFSLSIVVPAIAGPFDLGNVVVRAAIHVDKRTAALQVITDPLPTILQGVPLQVRIVRTAIDRSHFMLNPTSCSSKRVSGQVVSTLGAVANVATHYQVGNCNALSLSPHLALSVGAKGHTGRGAITPVLTKLTQGSGQSNLRSVTVTLPTTLNARLGVVNNACTQAQFDAGHCEQARTGTAVAVTPLLRHALRGSVYFVKAANAKPGALPNLVVALRGQVAFDLVGKITIPHGINLSVTFNAVPDVPVTQFSLRLLTGSHGAVGAAESLCTAKARKATASVRFLGQNGKRREIDQRLTIIGCRRKS